MVDEVARIDNGNYLIIPHFNVVVQWGLVEETARGEHVRTEGPAWFDEAFVLRVDVEPFNLGLTPETRSE